MFPKDNKIQSHENETLATEPDSYISFDSYDRDRIGHNQLPIE